MPCGPCVRGYASVQKCPLNSFAFALPSTYYIILYYIVIEIIVRIRFVVVPSVVFEVVLSFRASIPVRLVLMFGVECS